MTSPNPSGRRPLFGNEPSLRTRAVAVLVAALAVLVCLTQVVLAPTPVLVFLAALMIGGVRWPATPILVFAFLAALLVWTPNHLLAVFPVAEPLAPAESLLAVAAVVYVSLHYRLARAADFAARKALSPLPHSPTPESTSTAPWREWIGAAGAAVLAAVLARKFWLYLYVGYRMEGDFGLPPILVGFLVAVLLGGAVALLLPPLVGIALNRRKSRLESLMVLNEEIYRDMRRELRRVAKHAP